MPNNMPDLVFRYLLGQKGWDTGTDLTIQNYTDGQEALSNLLAGNAEFAVLPEHAARRRTGQGPSSRARPWSGQPTS